MALILHSGAFMPLQKKMRWLKERSSFDLSLCLLLESVLKITNTAMHIHMYVFFAAEYVICC